MASGNRRLQEGEKRQLQILNRNFCEKTTKAAPHSQFIENGNLIFKDYNRRNKFINTNGNDYEFTHFAHDLDAMMTSENSGKLIGIILKDQCGLGGAQNLNAREIEAYIDHAPTLDGDTDTYLLIYLSGTFYTQIHTKMMGVIPDTPVSFIDYFKNYAKRLKKAVIILGDDDLKWKNRKCSFYEKYIING
jgi:hypothetical protein